MNITVKIMLIRPIIYAIIIPVVLYALDSLNYEKLLKKNKVFQARLLYLILTISISYLLVSFMYDFF